VVGGSLVSDNADPCDPAVTAVNRLHLVTEAELHAALAEVIEPGIDPDVARRSVQHSVHLTCRVRHVEQELEEDVAARARTHLPRTRGDQRASQTVGQIPGVGRRAGLGTGEFPPADVFVLREAPLLAAREQQQEPVDEVRGVFWCDPDPIGVLEEEPKRLVKVGEAPREVRGCEQLFTLLRGDLYLARGDEVVGNRPAPIPVRNAADRVWEVPVEAGEEAKPVLARQGSAPLPSRARERKAPGLAADGVAGLEDGHTEAALAEFMSRAQARDTATKHDHPIGHQGSNYASPPLTALFGAYRKTWIWMLPPCSGFSSRPDAYAAVMNW
jgi:hypothetical protein